MSEIRITDIKIQINDINNWIWIYQKFDLVLSKIRINDIRNCTYLEISVIELLM